MRTSAYKEKQYKDLPVISRRDYQEILLARMAGGDLYAMEELEKVRRIDKLLDLMRDKPLYKE